MADSEAERAAIGDEFGAAGTEPEPEPVAPAEKAPPAAPPYAAVTKTPVPAPAAAEPVSSLPPPGAPPKIRSFAPPAPRAAVPTTTYKPPSGPVIPPGKPVRKVPNPELEGEESSSVGTMPRRGLSVDVGTKKRRKSSWLVTGALALLGLLAVAGVISYVQDWRESRAAKSAARAATASAAPKRAMSRERQDALKLLMRDDAASVERAAAQLEELVRRQPASAARADNALALALLSQQAADEAVRLESRARLLEEERTRTAEGEAGATARAAELTAEADTARAEIPPLRERAVRLLSEARAELDALPAELGGDVAAVRARAWVQLVSGAQGDAARTASAAPPVGEDPWLALAAIVADIPVDASREALAALADRLEQLAAKHPEFVRPLLLAGRIRAALGDGERALRDFDGALKVNPQHLETRRVRAEIAPGIPDSGIRQGDASSPANEASPPNPSPAVNAHSQGGNAPAAPTGR